MTDRGRARHRAPSRATTPLTTLTTTARTGLQQAAEGGVDLIGRGGAAVVLSTGLVAATALTVSALPQPGDTPSADPTVTLDPASASLASFGRGAINQQPVSRGGTVVTSGAEAVQQGAATRAAAVAEERAARSAARQAALASATTATSPAERTAQTPRPTPTTRATASARSAQSSQRSTASRTTTPKRTTTTAAKRTTTAAKATTTAKATPTAKATTTAKTSSARGSSVLSVAARYVGIAYRYGGTTPAGFDCSGYTQYVFRQVGVSLPRTAAAQYSATTRVSRSEARPGDLVFVLDGGIGHVGIYAGGNMMYDSPRSGKSISKRSIWTSNVAFGRV